MTRLTPHFTLEELTFSNTATRLGIDNTPNDVQLSNLMTLAEGLELVRTKLDGHAIRVSSGFRSMDLNRALRSKDTSYHTYGLAADFTCSGFGDVYEVMESLAHSSIEFDQLILEFGIWLHVAFPKGIDKPRRQMLSIGKSGVRIYE
tara:strand:+ start:13544 stop:13984 length:441 start_codon:yes stop_codon:yes gene_type:complete